MKARCVRVINELTGEPLPSNSWLTVGNIYQILAVFVAEGGATKYRLLGNDGKTPALHAANQFEIVSSFLPSIWKAHSVAYKYFELAPESWSLPGFWESYFDNDRSAEASFFEAYRSILEEENVYATDSSDL